MKEAAGGLAGMRLLPVRGRADLQENGRKIAKRQTPKMRPIHPLCEIAQFSGAEVSGKPGNFSEVNKKISISFFWLDILEMI